MTDTTSTYEAALHYHEQGWQVLPLHHMRQDGTCSCGDTDLRADGLDHHPIGKHPTQRRWQDAAPLTTADLYTAFAETPSNIGIVTGAPSGIFVIDVDNPEALMALEDEHGRLPATFTVATGRGVHYV